ncbi:GAP1-N2 domain-containing protein [Corynebacterium variabile]|uniref:GAP1-N2 domain-containing protein n=1 Tax=Corynebacterium variabile TaxID=1727 RepID=UPI003FD63A57
MSGSFSYASFSPRDDRPGGWSVGQSSGELSPMWKDEIIAYIPTQISDPVTLSSFPDKADLARRLRRFAWLPAPWKPGGSADTGVFFASSPAGQDASGRPGNVFTYALVSDAGELPQHHAVKLMFSRSVPAPYGKRKVDDAVLPELGPGFSGAEPSPLTDDVLDAFLAGAPAESAGGAASLPVECSRVTAPTGSTSRQEVLGALVELVMNGRQVVFLTDPAEGPLWVAALARVLPETLPGDRSFTWSTYERATGVAEVLKLGTSLVIMPPGDREKLPENTAAVLVDPGTPLPAGDTVAPAAGPVATPASDTAGAWDSAFGAVPAESARQPGATPANPFASAPTEPDAPTAAPESAPSREPEPATAPTRADGIHPAIVRLRKDDEDFIRTARINSWDVHVNGQPPYAEDWNNWKGKDLDNYRTYLLLDPATELGWTARIRVLALLSYGYIPPAGKTPRRTSLNEWAMTALAPRTTGELIADTVEFSVRHGFDDEKEPDLSLIGDPTLLAMAQEVFRRRTDLKPVKPRPAQRQAAPVQQMPPTQQQVPPQFPRANDPYARQSQYFPPQSGLAGPSSFGWNRR